MSAAEEKETLKQTRIAEIDKVGSINEENTPPSLIPM
jgi:hypothetical protein